MKEELDEDVLNVVERWQSLGFLEGLPILEKTELALIYDNATRLLLSQRSLSKIPKKVQDSMDETIFPICRRLYKRVGPNFDIETMLSTLLESIEDRIHELLLPETKEKNPIVDFCVEFADNYEDEVTNKNRLTDEEYKQEIKLLLSKLEEVLLSDDVISYVNKEKEDKYNLNKGKTKRTKKSARFWNQTVAKNLLTSALSDINKGL